MIGRRWYAKPDRQRRPRCSTIARRASSAGASTVIEAVDDHGGRVRVGDSEWSARGGPATPGRARSE